SRLLEQRLWDYSLTVMFIHIILTCLATLAFPTNWQWWLAVFIGGGLGSLARFAVTKGVLSLRHEYTFPLATLTANLLASAVLAIVTFWMVEERSLSPAWKLFWAVGFCGGFSTFSTFSLENWVLLKNGNYGILALNILLSVALCCAVFVWMDRKSGLLGLPD
ncbi:MAG: fluoride efflux transporter CrcB, partial [Owenweeksia sp.]